MKTNDLTGQVFGRLTVIKQAPNHGRRVAWQCRCSCGNANSVQSNSLVSGKTKSCGCLLTDNVEAMSKTWEQSRKHGHASGGKTTATWRSWNAMFSRCYNAKCKDYSNYGGRGIAVCTRWTGEKGFENFLADVGEKPSGKTLDRRNNDGVYEPGNCRWATQSEQNRNSSLAKLTMLRVQEIHGRHEHGESKASISRRMCLHHQTVSSILCGESWKDALYGYPTNA